MTSDDDTVSVSRGMLRRWAETLEDADHIHVPAAPDVVAQAIRAVLAPGSDTAGET